MNTRDIILLAEYLYLLHRERDTSPFDSYAEAVKVAGSLAPSLATVQAFHDLQAADVSADVIADLAGLHDPRTPGVKRFDDTMAGMLVESDLRKHLANALAVLDVIAPRPWVIRPDRYEPDVTIITDANERCTCGDADLWSPADIENLNLLSVRPNAWDPTQADVDLVLRAIDTTTDHGRPWTIEHVWSWLTAEMETALGRHGWTEADLLAVANSLPRAEPSAPSTDVKTDVSASHPASMSHEEVMVALAMSGALCKPCPDPWEAVREDEYYGAGTAHVWSVYSASGTCLVALPASVDGPAFVAWVNRHAPADVSLSWGGELRVSERPRAKPLVQAERQIGQLSHAEWSQICTAAGLTLPTTVPALVKAVDHNTEAAQGFARVAELLLGPGRHAYTVDGIIAAVQQLQLAQASGAPLRMPALYSTRQAIADAGLPITLSAADAVKQLAAQRDENAAKYLALLADFDKLREQARRSEHIAASKEPKLPQRIYDALTHVWPQDYADRIAKVGNALAAIGIPLDCERISDRGGRFDLLLPAHNSRVQLRANGEAVVTGEAAHLVELGGLKADIEHVLRADGWKVSG